MRRGQGTVELALFSLVFVSILVFGIHFAEVGALKLRVQQAAVFATWQATGDRAHRLDRATSKQSPIFYHANQLQNGGGQTPEQAARARYRDFDGVGGANRNQVNLATTEGTQLRVRCEPARVAVPPVLTDPPIVRLASAYTFARYNNKEVDGVGCGASAQVALAGFPKSVLEGSDGFFKWGFATRPTFTVCAIGRAEKGVCNGAVPFAIDDWGLQGDQGRESDECDFDCSELEKGGNIAYKQTVERLYVEYAKAHTVKNWSIENFVRELFTKAPDYPTLMTVVPVDETDFRFAFIGEDHAKRFQIKTTEIDGSGGFGPSKTVPFHWATSPYSSKYKKGYQDRGECFAGMPCSRSSFDKQHW